MCFLLNGLLFPVYKALSCRVSHWPLTTSHDFMPLWQGGCFISQAKKQKANCFDLKGTKNHPDFESPLETALRYTEQSTKVRFLHRKNYLTPSQKPGGKQVCFCLSLLSLWLFKHICYQRLQEFKHSMSRKHQGIPEVSIWPPSMWSWKAHLYQKDGNHLAGFQGAFLALIQFC